MRCCWQVEKDDYACSVLKNHWPKVPRYRDVRYFLGGKRWRQSRTAWEVDLICGGFPCQDISNAGKRAGIGGERSGLWSEFARIVRLLRPSYVLVENVPALTVRGLYRVLGDLAKLGYDAEWDRIPACAVGAPHLRWRLFIVAYANGKRESQQSRSKSVVGRRTCNSGSETLPNSDQPRLEIDFARQEGNECTTSFRGRGQDVSDAEGFGWREGRTESDWRIVASDSSEALPYTESLWAGQRWRKQFQAYCESQRNLYWPHAEPPVCGVDDGVPHRVDRLRGLGNAVVPQIAEWIGRMLMANVQARAAA